MEKEVECTCSGDVIARIILYSDQTALSHNKRTQGWPLVMTLGNITANLRGLPGGHALLAVLSIVGPNNPGVQETRMPSRTKLELLHKCMEIILAKLKEASYSGVHMKDPFGESQWVFPKFCLYIYDQTEGSRMTCTFDTNKANYPCSYCFCPKKLLNSAQKTFPYRTQERMKEILAQIQHSHSAEDKEQLSRAQSIHLIQCSLWGFSGGDSLYGNPYRCIQVDGLHQSIVGIFKTLVDIVRKSATSLSLVKQPLREMHKQCRYASFRLLGSTNQSGYFQSNANFHGFEHKFIMQVVIFCLLGLVPSTVIQVFVNFLNWYLLAFQSKQHTESSLNSMDLLMQKVVGSMKKHLKTWQKCNFDIVKVHAMMHLKDCIMRCGLPLEYDTCIYEHLHIALMKIPYRHSNKRNFMGQIVRHNQRMKMLLGEANLQEDLWVHEEDVTALDKAILIGDVAVVGKDLSLLLRFLHSAEDALPREVKELFGDQPEIPKYLWQALVVHLKDKNCALPEMIQLWNSLAVPAGEGKRFADWPMYIRACRRFHGREWFGFVSIQMEATNKEPVTWVGQLRLLFSCEISTGGKRNMKSLAFIRLMTELPRDGDWRLLHCRKLQWADEVASTTRKNDKRNPEMPYIVVAISNISRVVHVIPNFTQVGTYFENRFKL